MHARSRPSPRPTAKVLYLHSTAMPPANNRALPTKEAKLFREVLNHYESRALKAGLKAADQILKKFPDHGGG